MKKMAESGDDLQTQKKIIVRKTPLKARPKKHVYKSVKDGFQMKYTSSKLSSKEKSGIKDVHEPSNSGNGASNTDLSMAHEDLKSCQYIEGVYEPLNPGNGPSTTDLSIKYENLKLYQGSECVYESSNSGNGACNFDLSMEHEDLKPHQDIDNGFESNENLQAQESYRDSCRSSSVEDYYRYDGVTSDAPEDSEQMSKISSPCEDISTEIEVGRLSPMMVRTTVISKPDKLLEYVFIRSQNAPDNTIDDNLKRAGNCNELATSTKLKHVQQLARSRETFNLDELPTLREVEECAEVAKDILNDAEKLMKNAKKLMGNAMNLLDDVENLRDADIGKKVVENSEKSMDKAKVIFNYASKLISIGEKLMQNSEKLSDIILKWEENFSDWNEDLGNGGSFPTFLANFLLVAALFGVLVVPALFAKYAPSDFVMPSVTWQSIFGFNVSSPDSP